MRIEFFQTAHDVVIEGQTELVKLDGQYITYTEFESDQNRVRVITEFLMDRPRCAEILMQMSRDGITNPKDRLRQFKRCNLDALDRAIDIDTDANYFNPEYVSICGHKGANKHCPYAAKTDDMKPYCILKNKYQIPLKNE
jgi:hypothetical protein